MAENGLVSIIIPTYGRPDRLRRCIQSALDQDYENIEVIVVDDNGAGTDCQREAERITASFAGSAAPVYYLRHKTHMNGSAARNTGIRFAHGDHIALLDDDDAFYPHKLSRQMKALGEIKNPNKISCCSFRVTRNNKVRKAVKLRPVDDIAKAVLLKQMEMPSSGMVFTKSCHNAVNGFDESFQRHQDWEFLIRAGQACEHTLVETPCFDKDTLRRNSPRDPDLFYKQRQYYLEKMKRVVMTYAPAVRHNIRVVHAGDIAIQYFRAGRFFKGVSHMFKSGNFIKCKLYIFVQCMSHLACRVRELSSRRV